MLFSRGVSHGHFKLHNCIWLNRRNKLSETIKRTPYLAETAAGRYILDIVKIFVIIGALIGLDELGDVYKRLIGINENFKERSKVTSIFHIGIS